jgi:hypothetical protein
MQIQFSQLFLDEVAALINVPSPDFQPGCFGLWAALHRIFLCGVFPPTMDRKRKEEQIAAARGRRLKLEERELKATGTGADAPGVDLNQQ